MITLTYDHIGKYALYNLDYTPMEAYSKLNKDGNKNYLAFEALEDGTFTFSMDAKVLTDYVKYVAYSIDGGKKWVKADNINGEVVTLTTPTIKAGEKVLWKGKAILYGYNTDSYPGGNIGLSRFVSTGLVNLSGNIMSMIYEDDFESKTTLPTPITTQGLYGNGTFALMFAFNGNNSCKVVSAENLELPATTLSFGCYSQMFNNNTLLTTAPELPATTLAGNCYCQMFSGCTHLTTAPALPATILTDSCYSSMFSGCTALTTAPELPATILTNRCYGNMFNGCTSLTTAPALPAETLATYCYSAMFSGCSSLTSAPTLSATVLSANCYRDMFNQCSSLTTAPELPATTLALGCYNGMFQLCTNLTKAPALPAETLANDCYGSMFNGCSKLTKAPILPATTLTTGCYYLIFKNCSLISAITILATSKEFNSLTYWTQGVRDISSGVLTVASGMDNTTMYPNGFDGKPSSWSFAIYQA